MSAEKQRLEDWNTSPEDALRVSILSGDVNKGRDVDRWNLTKSERATADNNAMSEAQATLGNKYAQNIDYEQHLCDAIAPADEVPVVNTGKASKYSIIDDNPYDVQTPGKFESSPQPVAVKPEPVAKIEPVATPELLATPELTVKPELTAKSEPVLAVTKAEAPTVDLTQPIVSDVVVPIKRTEQRTETKKASANDKKAWLAIYAESQVYFERLENEFKLCYPLFKLTRIQQAEDLEHDDISGLIIHLSDDDESDLLDEVLDRGGEISSLFLSGSVLDKKCLDKIGEFLSQNNWTE